MTEDRDEAFARLRALPFGDLRADGEAGAVFEEAPSSQPDPSSDTPHPLAAADVTYSRSQPAVRFWLEHPFRRGKARVSFIDLIPPTYADVLATVAGFRRHTETFAAMSGLTEAEIAALRWPDAERLIKLCHLLMPDLTGV